MKNLWLFLWCLCNYKIDVINSGIINKTHNQVGNIQTSRREFPRGFDLVGNDRETTSRNGNVKIFKIIPRVTSLNSNAS